MPLLLGAAEPGDAVEPAHAEAPAGMPLGSLRLTAGAADLRGTQMDQGPGLSYQGWTYNDVALSGDVFGTGAWGASASFERGAFSLMNNGNRVTSGGLLRASVGPAGRARVGPFTFKLELGYGFAQVPVFGNSAQPSLARALRHALLASGTVQLALPAALVLEARGTFPIVKAVQVPGLEGASSNGFTAGAALLLPSWSLGTTALRLGVDYEFTRDRVSASSPQVSLVARDTINRVGVLAELSFGAAHGPPPVGSLRLTVLAPEGKVLEGAAVQLSSPSAPSQQVLTGPQGTAEAERLAPGPWHAEVHAEGFLPGSAEAQVENHEVTALVVSLKPVPPTTGAVNVKVLRTDTLQPLKTAVVVAAGASQPVDADGSQRFPGLKPGPIAVQASAPGFAPAQEAVTVVAGQSTELLIKLRPNKEAALATLSGLIRSVRGRPVAATLEIPSLGLTVRASEQGTFSTQVKAGNYRVLITARGYHPQAKSVSLRPGDQAIFNVDLFPGRP